MQGILLFLGPGGIGFMSFKEGEGERSDSGRHFTDFTEETLDESLADETDLAVLRIWGTDDLRPGRTQRWVNALVNK